VGLAKREVAPVPLAAALSRLENVAEEGGCGLPVVFLGRMDGAVEPEAPCGVKSEDEDDTDECRLETPRLASGAPKVGFVGEKGLREGLDVPDLCCDWV